MTAVTSNWLHNAVSALACSLARPHADANPLQGGESGGFEPPFNDLTRFILEQHAQMPDYLRAPMRMATLAFDTFGVAKGGRRFHRQPPELRLRQVAAWKNSSIGFQRDLIRYFESLATLALYSRDQAGQRLPADVP